MMLNDQEKWAWSTGGTLVFWNLDLQRQKQKWKFSHREIKETEPQHGARSRIVSNHAQMTLNDQENWAWSNGGTLVVWNLDFLR